MHRASLEPRVTLAASLVLIVCWAPVCVRAVRCSDDGGIPCVKSHLHDGVGHATRETAAGVGTHLDAMLRERVQQIMSAGLAWLKPGMQHLADMVPSVDPASLLEASADEDIATSLSAPSAEYVAAFAPGAQCPLTNLVVAGQTVATDMRIGCRQGCSCPSFQVCYLRHSWGVCDTGMYTMVLMSVAIFFVCLCALFMLRVYFLWREFVLTHPDEQRPHAESRDKREAEKAAADSGPREVVIFDDESY